MYRKLWSRNKKSWQGDTYVRCVVWTKINLEYTVWKNEVQIRGSNEKIDEHKVISLPGSHIF